MAPSPDEPAWPSPLTINRRKAILGALLALALAAGAFTILGAVARLDKLDLAVRRADKAWLPICLAGQLVAYLGYILAYRDAARASGGPCFGWSTTARIVVFGVGASVLSASVGGLAVDFWALRRAGTAPRIAARRVLAVGTIEWTVLAAYALLAALSVLVTGEPAPAAMVLGWVIAVPVCVASAMWLTSTRRVRRLVARDPAHLPTAGHPLTAIAVKARGALADALAGVLLVRHLLSHPVRYRDAAIGYPIYWAGEMLTLYAAIRAFGVSVPVGSLVLAYATSFVISALPLPAGGAGGVEAAVAFALTGIGIPLAPALLSVFLFRIVTFWLPVLPALMLLPGLRSLNATLPSVPRTRPDADEGISFRPRSLTSAHSA
jgi:undecaprenyl-diphosphatase